MPSALSASRKPWIVGQAVEIRKAILVPDVSKDPRYIEGNPETRSELAVPLIYKDKVIGVLDLEHTRRGFFTDEHRRTVTTLAAQVAIAIENAQLYEEIARQERRLERDLSLARELQMRLLPQTLPKVAHLDLAAKFTPARAIGGDLYDFIPYSLSRLGIVIGDVSGKGAPAAIYAALVSGILRSHAPIEPGPAEMKFEFLVACSACPIWMGGSPAASSLVTRARVIFTRFSSQLTCKCGTWLAIGGTTRSHCTVGTS